MTLVENFLLKRLDDAINGEPENNSTKMFPIHTECRDLMKSIKLCRGELIELIKKRNDGAPFDSIIKENLYYLINVMTEWHMLLKNHHPLSPETIPLANDLSRRVAKIKKDLQDAQQQKKTHSVPGGGEACLEVYRWSCRSVDPKKVYGVEDKARIMERFLAREDFKAIGIVGMAGVGKTALCQKVFHNEQVKQHFLPRIWACLSKQPKADDHKKEVGKLMLICLGFEKKIVEEVGKGEEGEKRLILALQHQLKRQRYLIVLDDAWNTEEEKFYSWLTQDEKKKDPLEGLPGYGLPKGGACIVTSRSPTITGSMVGEKNSHILPFADEESCWKIFKDAVEKGGTHLTQDIQKLQDEIVKKCAGLPLIAHMLGKISTTII